MRGTKERNKAKEAMEDKWGRKKKDESKRSSGKRCKYLLRKSEGKERKNKMKNVRGSHFSFVEYQVAKKISPGWPCPKCIAISSYRPTDDKGNTFIIRVSANVTKAKWGQNQVKPKWRQLDEILPFSFIHIVISPKLANIVYFSTFVFFSFIFTTE